jgi:hypothetical protein
MSWNFWDVRIPAFLCPSDGLTTLGLRQQNYLFCFGDSASGTNTTQQIRGLFGTQVCYGVRDILDGTSNTIAMSEGARGTGSGPTSATGSQSILNFETQYDPLAGSPAGCRGKANGNYYISGNQVKSQRGGQMWDGQMERTGFNTLNPPNSPQCSDGNSGWSNADSPNCILPPTSLHVGGVHALMADGAVRFISDNIDSGNSGATPPSTTTSSMSPYGTWGALGTRMGGELVGEFLDLHAKPLSR